MPHRASPHSRKCVGIPDGVWKIHGKKWLFSRACHWNSNWIQFLFLPKCVHRVCVYVCAHVLMNTWERRQRKLMFVELVFWFKDKNYVPSVIFHILHLYYLLHNSFRDITPGREKERDRERLRLAWMPHPVPQCSPSLHFPFLDEKCPLNSQIPTQNSDGHSRLSTFLAIPSSIWPQISSSSLS